MTKSNDDPWILIGCPVYAREWILPYYFAAIEKQSYPLENLGFIFLVAPHGDEATLAELLGFAEKHPELRCFDIVTDESGDHVSHIDGGPQRRRQWSIHRYSRMAQMRNILLDRVTCHDPDRYFSLDSDIILETPNLIEELVAITETRSAAAPLCFMVPPDSGSSSRFPNVMSWSGGESTAPGFRDTYPLGTLFPADVIMASVMMSPSVFRNVRYQYHRQGEDLGWSAECGRKGYDLWSASYLYGAHVMYKDDLPIYLEHGDPRGVVDKCRD